MRRAGAGRIVVVVFARVVLSSPAEGEQLREDIEDITTARDSSVTSVALQRRASSGVATRCIVCMLYCRSRLLEAQESLSDSLILLHHIVLIYVL